MGFSRREHWSGWGAASSSRGSSGLRTPTPSSYISCTGRWVLYQLVVKYWTKTSKPKVWTSDLRWLKKKKVKLWSNTFGNHEIKQFSQEFLPDFLKHASVSKRWTQQRCLPWPRPKAPYTYCGLSLPCCPTLAQTARSSPVTDKTRSRLLQPSQATSGPDCVSHLCPQYSSFFLSFENLSPKS